MGDSHCTKLLPNNISSPYFITNHESVCLSSVEADIVYVTGCGTFVSTRILWDTGELHSSTERDSSFPHPTPGVVPSIPMHI